MPMGVARLAAVAAVLAVGAAQAPPVSGDRVGMKAQWNKDSKVKQQEKVGVKIAAIAQNQKAQKMGFIPENYYIMKEGPAGEDSSESDRSDGRDGDIGPGEVDSGDYGRDSSDDERHSALFHSLSHATTYNLL